MRIVILGAPHSAHIIKWVKGLVNQGHEIKLIGFCNEELSNYDGIESLEKVFINLNSGNTHSLSSKFKWISSINRVRKAVLCFNPDIVHAHYATSYGLLGVLTRIKPLVISAWGSDVYEFPKRSVIHKTLLKSILKRASVVLATGNELANEVRLYTSTKVEVVPFGVNINLFKCKKEHGVKNAEPGTIHIGVIKNLEPVYGISTFLRALSQLISNYSDVQFIISIAGAGSIENELRNEARELGIAKLINFKGYIENEKLPELYDSLDLAVIPSLRESFGMSLIEAMSMGVPVIASDVSGFEEVGSAESISYFEAGNVNSLLGVLEQYVKTPESFYGKITLARKIVEERYSEERALALQVSVYEGVIGK